MSVEVGKRDFCEAIRVWEDNQLSEEIHTIMVAEMNDFMVTYGFSVMDVDSFFEREADEEVEQAENRQHNL